MSSAERAPPPMVAFASHTSTEHPARASVIAAARPFGPDPTTTASYSPRIYDALEDHVRFSNSKSLHPDGRSTPRSTRLVKKIRPAAQSILAELTKIQNQGYALLEQLDNE